MNTHPAIIALLLAVAGCASDPLPLGSGDGSTAQDAGPQDAVQPIKDASGDDSSTPDTTSDAEWSDISQNDADATEEAPVLTEGDPLEPIVVPLWTRAVSFLAALSSDDLLVYSDDEILRFVPGQDLPIHLGTTAGVPLAATLLAPSTLVAGTKGVYVVQGSTLAKSPLSAALGKTTLVHDMVTTPAGDLWIATIKGLYRWRGEALAPVVPGELPDRDALLAWGPPHEGEPALWVAADGAIYAIVESTDGALSTWPERDALPVTALAADGEGALWAVSEGGAVHRRAPDGAWRSIPLPDTALALASPPASKALWILGAAGLYRVEGGVLRAADDVTKGATLLGAGTDGSALLAGPQGLYRVHPGHLVTVGGLVEGQTVGATQLVTIHPTPPGSVDTVTADVDGAPLTVETDPWQVTISPAALGDGPHTLSVSVTWQEGEPAAASVAFMVESLPIPTWSGDIQPLYADRCAKCHAAAVTKTPLDTYEVWVARIDEILVNVGNGNMPLPPNPPLTTQEIGSIAAWRDAAFPE